ncbi:phospholipase D family protein [Pseudolysobacter antarcticus]|uniref:Phospholipase D family protein n=1 Tax=Pseudolysobacter antarcticus TaxID=2511995 RepID=A0A411HER9_9GAMM|nr:phospholipase D family protein [Pseudolysobacter antarcticus]QBB68983.1 phospholipase D family protein [Pseudolysobacter antarcticus]
MRIFIHLLVATLVAMTAVGCSGLRPDFVKQASTALPPVVDTPSARYIASELNGHAEQSGFRLLGNNINALLSRVALADHAQHSLDLQYYIFHNDATGRLIAQHLLAAADRGVRVRILLDDLNLTDEDRLLDALDAHENIEIRRFNPFQTRAPSMLSKVAQFALEGRRLNRRMHNKSFIADNTAAIIGGRNIGADYFGADKETNFRDLDLVAIGPVVKEASQIFDDYWNCDAAFPVAAYKNTRDTPPDLARLRSTLQHDARAFEQSDYALASLEELPNGATADRRGEWFWGAATVIADQPEKIDARDDNPALRIGPKLKTMIDAAQTEVLVMSPYFVPGDSGASFLSALAQRGVSTKILTNSLAATDEPAAHTGYARYRHRLLEGGVQLYELRPAPGEKQSATAHGTSSGVSLHAKAVVGDDEHVFIGSMNMDQRSKLLNTEMGVIIDSPALAHAVKKFFDDASAPQNAFHVVLQDSPDTNAHAAKMSWLWSKDGATMSADSEPDATKGRRFEVFMLRLLPIEGLL